MCLKFHGSPTDSLILYWLVYAIGLVRIWMLWPFLSFAAHISSDYIWFLKGF